MPIGTSTSAMQREYFDGARPVFLILFSFFFIQFYGISEYLVYFWIYVAISLVIALLALLVVLQHVYYAKKYRFLFQNRVKMVGAIFIFLGMVGMSLNYGINPRGFVSGFQNTSQLIFEMFLTYIAYIMVEKFVLVFLCFLTMTKIACAISINTANWISIAVSATSTFRKSEASW
jgi:hypothetical protein